MEQRHRAQHRRHAHDPARGKHRSREDFDDHGQQVIDGDAHRTRRSPACRSRPTAFRFSKAAWTTSQDFSGNGAATQSNKLDGFITVTVYKRLSNGNLLVRGQKWVAINSGREFVRLQGIVRPSDIAPDNSVLSWRVADAYISYGGQGTVANASKPGWLFRFFNSPHTPF